MNIKAMPGLFSFVKIEWDDVFQHPGILLPGIEQVSVIAWSNITQQLKVVTRGKDGNVLNDHTELMSKAEGKFRLQKFRSVNKPSEWIRISESPLIQETEKEINPDLFTEIQNTILVLRFRNESDSKYDALLIYLNKNLSQFGTILPEKVLSVENKSIIGHILYNYFRYVITINRHNHSVLQSIQQSIRSISKENVRLKDEIRQVSRTHEEMIINLSWHYLQTINEKYLRDYTFTDEALEKLKSFRGNIRHLPAIIEQAVVFCENILFADTDAGIKLESSHITFDNFQVEKEEPSLLKRIDSRESRTIQLLDKLEKAAMILKSKDIPLTGTNIGGALPQPITAPAITDALKKHRNGIISLLKKYPQKWELIREEFRPVSKLIRSEPEQLKEEGIA